MTLEEYFDGYEQSRQLFLVLHSLVEEPGHVELRISKSQIAFRQGKSFAWAWVPGKYLRGKTAPLVLTVALPGRDGSSRWKQIVEPAPGRFIHHLEIYTIDEIDKNVRFWLQAALKHLQEKGESSGC